jgi:hypothetical protein
VKRRPVTPLRAHKTAKKRERAPVVEYESDECDTFDDEDGEDDYGEEAAHFEDADVSSDEDAPMSQFDDWNNTVDELSGTSDEDCPQWFGG